MLKCRILIEHNNKNLLTSLAVVKRTCFDHINRHVGQSSRREYSYNFQKESNLSRPQTIRDMWTQIEIQIGIELETRRNKNSNLKQSVLILCNNCNMQFVHLPSSCANLQHANMHQARLSSINNSQVIYMY